MFYFGPYFERHVEIVFKKSGIVRIYGREGVHIYDTLGVANNFPKREGK